MKRLLLPVLCCAVVFGVWFEVLQNGFVWDDLAVVIGKQSVNELDWVAMLTRGLWDDVAGFDGTTPYFRPVLVLTLGFDRWVSGSAPWFVHLHSLVWHLANVALVAHFLRKSGWMVASGAAILVGVHPSIVEAVAFAAARNDVLVTTFALLSMLAMQHRRWGWVFTFGMFAAASKENAVLLPLVLLLVAGDRWSGFRAALFSGLGVVLIWAARYGLGIPLPASGTYSLVEVGHAMLTWLGWLAWPAQVAALAGETSDLAISVGVGFCVLAALGARVRYRSRQFAGPVLAAIIVLLPGLPAVAKSGLYAPRYLYLPAFLLAATAAATIPRTRAMGALLIGLILAAAVSTRARIPEWRHEVPLYMASVKRAPNGRGWLALGDALSRSGRTADALGAFDTALDHAEVRGKACSSIAIALSELPEAAAAGLGSWGRAGCRAAEGFDDAVAWALVRDGGWSEAGALLETQTIADGTGRSRAVRGAFRLADGDWAGLMTAGIRDPLGASHYLDAAYGVHLSR